MPKSETGREDCHNPFHNAHTIPSRVWEGRDKVYNAPEALISWTLAHMCRSAGNLQQGWEGRKDGHLQNLSLPKYRVFPNPPPHPSPGNMLKEEENTFQ
jgi:hypothetical protein